MGLPHIVIVGRPNVGKSSIFNWLAGKRLAIVDPTAGVTRDRVIHIAELDDRFVELVDTGGMGVIDSDNLTEHIEEQIRTAIEAADLILFVVDTIEGIMPLDEEVARRLRHAKAPILCVANKTDHDGINSQADDFYRFGHPIVRVSTQQNRGKQRLIDEVIERLPEASDDDEELANQTEMKVALVGRRNTGKSTFINTLTQTDRMIVSEVPGTTRDSVDVRFELDGKAFTAIDTPGLRRGKSVKTNVDYFGIHRAQRSIRRADVTLLFFDASQQISKVDKQLCDYISKEHRPCIFVVNKWDLLVDQMPTERWATYLRDTFRTMWHVPIAFITGQTGKNVKTLINHAQMLFKQSHSRVSTADLNQLIKAALELNPPPLVYHRRPKIYYATQVATQPPTIVLFCNNPKWISHTYKRYLLGVLRDQLEFGEVPIRLFFRRRETADETDHLS